MDYTEEVIFLHTFKCASCGERFDSEKRESRCPYCKGKVLIHEKGEQFRSKSCNGSCSCCSGCGH